MTLTGMRHVDLSPIHLTSTRLGKIVCTGMAVDLVWSSLDEMAG